MVARASLIAASSASRREARRVGRQDAALAIDYAYAAIEEAEYAVLDSILAQREAEEAATAAGH